MNDALAGLIRDHYLTLQGYVSAGMETVKDDKKVFMNANENPFELPGLEGRNRYPQPQPAALLEGYAKLYSVKPENIVATRGADEAIVVLTDLFCEPHTDSIVVCPPTFGMYTRDASAMPAGIVEVPLLKTDNGGYRLDTENIIRAGKKEGAKLIFLCSPNNPTATSFELVTMIRICKELEGDAIVIVDETYIEFATQASMTAYLPELPNLIILRTLSKSYALAGMRMGCFISGDKDFIAFVRAKCLDAYPVPAASLDAALTVLKPANLKLAEQNRKKLLAERDRIRKAFEACELVRHISPSDANFLLIEMEDAKAFVAYCAKNNVILRDFSDKKLTENCIRISPGLPAENDRLLKLLTNFEKIKTAAA